MTKTAVITGANRGLGLAFATAYAKAGWTVLATARNPDSAVQLKGLSGEVHVLTLDVSSDDSIRRFKDAIGTRKIDLLINNAGILGRKESIREVTREDLLDMFNVNSIGPFLVTMALYENLMASNVDEPDLLTKVVNITSRAGSIEDNQAGGLFAYRASKAALNCLTKSMCVDFAHDGIKVATLALHPGFVQTDMTDGRGDISATESVSQMIVVIEQLSLENSGKFYHREGYLLPY